MQRKTILFDLSHNEMLNVEEDDYSNFYKLLTNYNLKIKKNEHKDLTKKVLENIDCLVIGNPINDFFSNIEVQDITNYVRVGGNLLLISEYGADFLQKTNLNDISGLNFGIFFEKNLIKESNLSNQNRSSIVHINNFSQTDIATGLREVVLGGSCSLYLNKASKPVLISNKNKVWSELYNNSTEEWVKDKDDEQILAACTEFGQGKVFAIGDIDIFSNDAKIGLESLDNQKFIQNVTNWLLEPVKKDKIETFLLKQIGDLQNNFKKIQVTLNNLIETMSILEKRISVLEEQSNKE